jgi:hypothetical protein
MDGPEFDKLARKLTSFTSRRQALGGLLGAAAAVTGLGAAAEAKKNGKNRADKKGPGKNKGKEKAHDKGKDKGKVSKDQCSPGCTGTGSSQTCNVDADCGGGDFICQQGQCRIRCFGLNFLCGPGGQCVSVPGQTNTVCACSPVTNNCPGSGSRPQGSTCAANGFCSRPNASAGGCQPGLDRNNCGNPAANRGVCSICASSEVCAPVADRQGGQCRARAGCGLGTCQFNEICTSLNDNRVCGAYFDSLGNPGTWVCNPACLSTQSCRGGDATPAGGINRTCGAPLCSATSCPGGCCQEQADFEQGIAAGCQSGTSRLACGINRSCVNCDRIGGPNCGCFNGQCSCTTTTTVAPTTTAAPTTTPVPTTPAQPTTTTSAPCGASNCTGCCQINAGVSTCITGAGLGDGACGIGGGACVVCSGKKHCKTSKGVCKKSKKKKK